MRNLSFLILILCLSSSSLSISQGFGEVPEPGNDESGGGFDDDVNDELIPINGLIALGLIAGAIYGIRKKK